MPSFDRLPTSPNTDAERRHFLELLRYRMLTCYAPDNSYYVSLPDCFGGDYWLEVLTLVIALNSCIDDLPAHFTFEYKYEDREILIHKH